MYTCMYLLDMCRHICRRKWHTTSYWAQGICSACLFFLAIVETIKYAGTLLSPYPTFDANEYLSAEEEYLHKSPQIHSNTHMPQQLSQQVTLNIVLLDAGSVHKSARRGSVLRRVWHCTCTGTRLTLEVIRHARHAPGLFIHAANQFCIVRWKYK